MAGVFRLYEIVADGLPVAVSACRWIKRRRCGNGESIRWLLSHLDEPTAGRLASRNWRRFACGQRAAMTRLRLGLALAYRGAESTRARSWACCRSRVA